MGLFTKKTTELETLEAKQGKLQEKSNELQTKISKIQNGLVVAETNLLVDETAANKKQIDKFKVAIEKTQKELEAVGAELSEVSSRIGAIHEAERQAEIDEAVKAYEEYTYLHLKRIMLEKKAEQLANGYYAKKPGSGNPDTFRKLAGLKSGESFDRNKPEQAPWIELSNKASNSGRERAEKDFEELVSKINAFLETN